MRYFEIRAIIVTKEDIFLEKLKTELGQGQIVLHEGEGESRTVEIKMTETRDGKSFAIKGAVVDETLFTELITAQSLAQDIVNAHDKDSAIISNNREQKLNELRTKRNKIWETVKIEINKHIDSHSDIIATEAEWRTYRNQLRDITEPYKNYTTDSDHADALDAVDINVFVMPTEPS